MHDSRFDRCSHLGIDLGDKSCTYCGLDEDGRKVATGKIRTTREAFTETFRDVHPLVIAIEVGTHSAWISRLLESFGHEVHVANPRRLPMIYADTHKSDELDAENLARLVRYDRKLLQCIQHRSEGSQRLLSYLRTRDQLVRSRTALINSARGQAKSAGYRLQSCSPAAFHHRTREVVVGEDLEALRPYLNAIKALNQEIRGCDRTIESWSEEVLPVTRKLREVIGVGPITAAAFILTLDDPERFSNSRKVGAYLGMVPRKRQTGERDEQTHITKAGNELLRRLLVNASQHILCRGPDSDLRRFGERIHARGGPRAYKIAVIAVARKLAVQLHRIWKTGERYEPLCSTS
jgi:transposase